MISKKLLPCILIAFATSAFAQEQTTKTKIYGYVGNDFFYNSRQNVEMVDGIIQLFPKPIELSAGADKNAVAQAEMLSVNTRLGVDITGMPVLGAKTSGKIEADFAGFGTSYYVFRIRQAYVKLNWDKTELLIGQTWHPLFGSVVPTTFSANAGGPFQPFNRSPQVRLKQNLNSTLSFTAAALYEMQYASQGPLGTINTYMKNALAPDLFVGLENKTKHWTNGVGVDFKTLKPDVKYVSSLSAVAYSQYIDSKFQVKAKAIYGQNLSDQLMIGGYGVSKYAADSTTVLKYTNFNNLSTWLNVVYGTKVQVGVLFGLSQNLGTNEDLAARKGGKYTAYGYGYYDAAQSIVDHLYRVAPQVSYNLSNIKFGLEYDYTTASYGNVKRDGSAINTYSVNNHRVLASVMYIF
ncbi:MAG TPA: hypothetical protein VJ602_05970 [Paludibacter sp.]|nr:hypothetical protein [Paludibacter sp.]